MSQDKIIDMEKFVKEEKLTDSSRVQELFSILSGWVQNEELNELVIIAETNEGMIRFGATTDTIHTALGLMEEAKFQELANFTGVR